MKKGLGVILIFTLLLVITVSGVFAEEVNNQTPEQKVSNAYNCLNSKIDAKGCSDLSIQENIFTTLSTKRCADELMEKSKDNECWPKSKCNVKETAQAIWAAKAAGEDTEKAEAWLLSKRIVPKNLVWYLQIDSLEQTTCKITYDGKDYPIEILLDKTINASAGNCLTIGDSATDSNNYWLEVSDACTEKQFLITCNKSFKAGFLFREKTEEIIHVLADMNSTTENGILTKKIQSFCFADKNECSPEGSLWAAMVLQNLDYNINSYYSYLVSLPSYIHGVFQDPLLYMITGEPEYKTGTLSKQIGNQYWKYTGDKFYDTALALLPFQGDDAPDKKQFSIDWLLGIQQEDGCWADGNIRSNGFLLYSIWPRESNIYDDDNETGKGNCLDNDFYCVSAFDCDTDNLLPNYACLGSSKCCSAEPESEFCVADLQGEFCEADEVCSGEVVYSDDATTFRLCCIGGTCVKSDESTVSTNNTISADCSSHGGTCETTPCDDGYEENTEYTCSDSYSRCCMKELSPAHIINWWIWVLFFLIVLVVISIIYRDKIKLFIAKRKSNGSSTKPNSKRPTSPSFPSRRTPRITSQPRKIIPNQPSYPKRMPHMRPRAKSPKELNDVLNKLKEMSK